MCFRLIVLFLGIGILLPSLAVQADPSGPSNTVGYWKLEVHPGFAHVSFPVLPDNKSLNNVLGNQLTGGATPAQSDQVFRWNPTTSQFQMCWYNSTTNTWQGEFNLFSEAESYWIYVQSGHPPTQTVVAVGNVVELPYYNMGTMEPGFNAIGSVWAQTVSLAEANLVGFAGGLYLFQSDLVLGYNATTGSYEYAWQNDGNQWQGNLTQLDPGRGYWIYIAPGNPGFPWTFYPQPISGENALSGFNLTGSTTYGSNALPLNFLPAPRPLPITAQPVNPSTMGGNP